MYKIKRSKIERVGWKYQKIHYSHIISKIIQGLTIEIWISGCPNCIVQRISSRDWNNPNRTTYETLYYSYSKKEQYIKIYPLYPVQWPKSIQKEINYLFPNFFKIYV